MGAIVAIVIVVLIVVVLILVFILALALRRMAKKQVQTVNSQEYSGKDIMQLKYPVLHSGMVCMGPISSTRLGQFSAT